MRGRLITNGILSILIIGSWILIIVSVVGHIKLDNLESINYSNFTFKIPFTSIIVFYAGLIFFLFFQFISFIMGIVTLSLDKHPSARGLTIFSGILGILIGGAFLNIIISFIAVWKINQNKQNILINK